MTRPARFQWLWQPTTRTPPSPEQRLQRLQGQPGRRHGSECDHKREMNDHIAPPSPTADRIVTIVGDQNSARLLRLGHNDEEFLKTGHPGHGFFSAATDS